MMEGQEYIAPKIKQEAIASPIQSIEVINKVVKLLFSYKRSATYKDIAGPAGLHPSNVSQALSASRDLGMTNLAGKKGLYVLTKDGEDYARLIAANREDEAKHLLCEIIQKNTLWADVVAFLKATKGEARDPLDLILDVERKLGKKWSQGMRRRVRDSYVSILTYASLVKEEGEKIISLIETEIPTVKEVAEVPQLPAQPSSTITPSSPMVKPDFEKLQSNDFYFEVRKDLSTIDFAKSQFDAWIDYVRKKLMTKEEGSNLQG